MIIGPNNNHNKNTDDNNNMTTIDYKFTINNTTILQTLRLCKYYIANVNTIYRTSNQLRQEAKLTGLTAD